MKQLIILAVIAFFTGCTSTSEQATKSPVDEPKAPQNEAKAQEVAASHINWMSFEEAQEKASKSPRKVIVDVYTPWCGPCKMMDRSTFQDPEVVKHINENFYAVKFNGESGDNVQFKGRTFSNPNFDASRPANRRNSPHQLTAVLGISGYPTLIVFDGQFNKVSDIVGYRNSQQLMSELGKLN